MTECNKPKKIWVIGPPGVGKTTFSKKLSKAAGLPIYELDNYFWKASWGKKTDDEFRAIVSEFLTAEHWIVDGCYFQIKNILEKRADIVIVLSSSLTKILFRVLKRSFKRILCKERVCGGNYESFKFLVSKDGLIFFTIKRYFFFKNICNVISKDTKIIRLSTERERKNFLSVFEISLMDKSLSL